MSILAMPNLDGRFVIGTGSGLAEDDGTDTQLTERDMELDTYDDWAGEECEFIGDLLEQEGLAQVLQTCFLMKQDRFLKIAELLHSQVQDFFHTPRNRRKDLLSKLENAEHRHVFLLAALHDARCAKQLLEELCQRGITGGTSQSKSSMLTASAEVARSIAAQGPTLWPFAEPDPFGLSHGWSFHAGSPRGAQSEP